MLVLRPLFAVALTTSLLLGIGCADNPGSEPEGSPSAQPECEPADQPESEPDGEPTPAPDGEPATCTNAPLPFAAAPVGTPILEGTAFGRSVVSEGLQIEVTAYQVGSSLHVTGSGAFSLEMLILDTSMPFNGFVDEEVERAFSLAVDYPDGSTQRECDAVFYDWTIGSGGFEASVHLPEAPEVNLRVQLGDDTPVPFSCLSNEFFRCVESAEPAFRYVEDAERARCLGFVAPGGVNSVFTEAPCDRTNAVALCSVGERVRIYDSRVCDELDGAELSSVCSNGCGQDAFTEVNGGCP